MTPLDYLTAPEFADRRLTEAINVPPYRTGRLGQLGLFADTPISNTFVRIGITDGEITIIPARERGGPANKNMRGDRAETILSVPHFPLDDAVTPSDIQNLMVYGADFVMETLARVYNEKLALMRSKHDATHAHLDWGALNGLIIDGENKLLADLYETFGLEQEVMPFALADAQTDIAAMNGALKAVIRRHLRGAPATGVRVFASSTWYDAYIRHASIREALKYYPVAGQRNPAHDDIADEFNFAGLTVERIDEEFPVRLPDNTFAIRPAVLANEAIAIPLGTSYFKRYVAPPDTIYDANRPPAPNAKIFVSTDELPHGKGRDVHTESNVLPVCLRPQIMVRLTL
ncbi:MAG: major capsid protein [Nocardioides sp.]|nr:major capsid protein [Nocardioides sp.]